MKLDTMYAISPLDGRYNKIGELLSPYFSEFALVKNRVKVEVLWLVFLLDNKIIDNSNFNDYTLKLKEIYESFSEEDYYRVKEIENITNHDVKAIELFVAEKLKKNRL